MVFKILTVFVNLCILYLSAGVRIATDSTKSNATFHPYSSSPSAAGQVQLTHNERNRRLIPYITYNTAGSQEHANPLHLYDNRNVQGEPINSVSTSKTKINAATQPPPAQFDYSGFQQQQQQHDPVPGYSYIPVAYIPGDRNINYNSQYYPATYYHDPTFVQNVKPHISTTSKPKYVTSTTLSSSKSHLPYFGEYFNQNAASHNPFHSRDSIRHSLSKPAYSLLSNSQPSDYLNFRYSDQHQTQSTTTPTTPFVEITSPKHYLVDSTTSKYVATPAHSLAIEYPETVHLAHSVPLTHSKLYPQIKTSEQTIQSSKTVMKTHETPSVTSQNKQFISKYKHAEPEIVDFTEDDIFKGYNLNKRLPERITSDNIKESIKTLSYILQLLQKADSIPQFNQDSSLHSKDIRQGFKEPHSPHRTEDHKPVNSLQSVDAPYNPTFDIEEEYSPPPLYGNKPIKDDENSPGKAGIDYPVYSVIPETSFTCKSQRYKGFFADPETKCQVWHYCDLNGGQASFLCPNGTIFNQAALTCDWWFNVKCSATSQLYVLNERLYKYIIPAKPSFPEDFSGPLVDQYLTEKFKETESIRNHKYPLNNISNKTDNTSSATNFSTLIDYEIPTHLLDKNL